MSIIGDGYVKMAHLAIVGSHSVNGVAKASYRNIEETRNGRFLLFISRKFNNKTNGITHRRWLLKANPRTYKTY